MLIDLDPTAGPAWVIGAGHVGCRKVQTLLRHGFEVQWATGSQPAAAYADLAQQVTLAGGRVLHVNYPDAAIDFSDASMVVAATSEPRVNAAILRTAHRAGVLAVAVDPHNDGTARFVAQRQLGPHAWVGVSTGGHDPKLSVEVVEHLSTTIDSAWRAKLNPHPKEASC